MKIAINALPVGPGMTGIGAYTAALVAATRAAGGPHEYVYVTADPSRLAAVAGGPVATLAPDGPPWLWEQLQLGQALRRRGVGLYHSPLFTCPLVPEVPSLVTVHDAIPVTRPDLCSPAFLAFWQRCAGPALRAARRVLTVSEFSRQELVTHLGLAPAQVGVVYQGLGAQFRPVGAEAVAAARRQFGLPPAYVLYVGLVEARKNVAGLVAALGLLAAELPDLHLVLVGRREGPGQAALDEVAAQPVLAGRLHWPGYVADDVLPALYAGARVFAFPSLYEGFGRPVIEAMAVGTPVLAAATTALPEIAGDAALLTEPTPAALAAGLRRLWTDESLRADLRARGLARAREFTLAQFGARLAAFYTETAGGP